MPRSRSTETRIRDASAVDMRRRGLTYDQIADALGLSSRSSAHLAVRRGIKDGYREDADEQTYLELERLDEMIRQLYRIVGTKHYAATPTGALVRGPDGQPLVDDGPVVAAVAQLRQCSESRRKLLGLDAPSRSRVEVITADAVDEAIRELESKHARIEAGDGSELREPAGRSLT